jgi:hypothetical protein
MFAAMFTITAPILSTVYTFDNWSELININGKRERTSMNNNTESSFTKNPLSLLPVSPSAIDPENRNIIRLNSKDVVNSRSIVELNIFFLSSSPLVSRKCFWKEVSIPKR